MQADTPLQRLLALTQAMHRQAKAGGWDQLIVIDKQRETLLNSSLNNGSLKVTDAVVIHQLRQLQDEIVKLAIAERRQLTQSHRQTRSRIDISQQYLDFSASGNAEPSSIQSATDKEAN